jgi:serine/threonine protein kinase
MLVVQKKPIESRKSRLHCLCEIVRVVHSQEITDHDLKPANIVFDLDSDVRLVDFGIAHH